MAELEFFDKKKGWVLQLRAKQGEWLMNVMPRLLIASENQPLLLKELKADYETYMEDRFEVFETSPVWLQLREQGLLVL